MLNKLNKFHDSKPGYAAFAAFGLTIAYVFVSYAIDSGSWFDYLIALLAIVVFLQNIVHLMQSLISRKPKRQR